ncbi:hypothetical protein BB559_002064 [Furculomyces boomerangus]|uniref:Oxysterol-binding protein n=1 Tax=Furculomyces boomerangus TaxID=61424 RepID=A0A2T9YYD6_9FUNG|nr:hypothetical protein BB559_002064 [Furculomyces boomerangus]
MKTNKPNPDSQDAQEYKPTETVTHSISYRSALFEYIKSVLSFKGDIVSLTCPTFLLSGNSILEISVHWGDHIDFLTKVPQAKTAQERILLVAKWLVSSFYGSYYTKPGTDSSDSKVKKPFNPILGEQFFARWESDEFGETKLVCEQVSHHPPVSALHIQNEKAKIYCNGFFAQKLKFTGTSMNIAQKGQMSVYLADTNETFCMSLPSLSINGLITGNPQIEVSGDVLIRSSTKATCLLKFHKKPWLFGEFNKFDGVIFSDLDQHDPGEFEDQASHEKHKIEEEQRALRIKEDEDGIIWKPKLFTFISYEDIPETKNDMYQAFNYLSAVKPEAGDGLWIHNDSINFFTNDA